jgi:hypothetical protein
VPRLFAEDQHLVGEFGSGGQRWTYPNVRQTSSGTPQDDFVRVGELGGTEPWKPAVRCAHRVDVAAEEVGHEWDEHLVGEVVFLHWTTADLAREPQVNVSPTR